MLQLLGILGACSEYGLEEKAPAPDRPEDSGAVDTSGDTAEDTGDAPDCREDYADAVLISVESAARTVYRVDPATAALTPLATLDTWLEPEANLNSSAFRADGSALVSDSGLGRILALDPCSGALEVVGATGGGHLCGIAFGPRGRLFGLDNDADQLVRVDPVTGAATPIGPLGFDLGSCGLAYDCVNDRLVGIDGAGFAYFTVDPTTGAAYDFVAVDVPFGSVGAEYDPRSRTLLASTGLDLYRIGIADGSATLAGSFGTAGNWDDLAYHTASLPCR